MRCLIQSLDAILLFIPHQTIENTNESRTKATHLEERELSRKRIPTTEQLIK